jgi:chemotaxis-related protein WspB
MLALTLHLGDMPLAVPASAVVEVLSRRELRPIALAPEGVVGLLPFRGFLVPVVDLCRLVLARECRPLLSSRLVVLSVREAAGTRLFAVLAEGVLDLVPVESTLPGLRLPQTPWLDGHLADAPGLPQLMEPQHLLPEDLARLFLENQGAGGAAA